MAAFPLLGLPILVIDKVFREMEFSELIPLSECSKRTRHLINITQKNGKKATLDIVIHKRRRAVVLNKGDRRTFKWCALANRRNTEPLTVFEDHVLDGTRMSVCVKNSEWATNEFNDEHLLSIIRHLKHLFSCHTTSFKVHFYRPFPFSKFFRETDLLHKADTITIDSSAVAASELTFLLDTLVTEHFHFDAYTDECFRYPKPIRFPFIDLSYSFWIRTSDLVEMVSRKSAVCRNIHTNVVDWTEKEFGDIVNAWLDGENDTLECVRVSKKFQLAHTSVLDVDKVFEGIPNSPGSKKRADAAKYFDPNALYQHGRDIRRKDGLLATFLLKTDADYAREVTLTVWPCKDPNIVE